MIPVAVTVNGVRHERLVEPRLLLSDFIRHELHLYRHARRVRARRLRRLHGAARRDARRGRASTLAVQADGAEIETVESLAKAAELDPLQQAFHEHFGLQCGFCTPGILMTARFFLEQNPSPTEEQVRAELAGNLCRCTGYAPIVDAILAASRARAPSG